MSDLARRRDEWLEADGLGGFASGCVDGIRTRRYHALLLAATTPPTGRFVLVNGFDAWLDTPQGRVPLTSQLYAPGVVHPDGARRLESFAAEPWPRWRFAVDGGGAVVQELVVRHGVPLVALAWHAAGPPPAPGSMLLCVRPFLSGRDYHAMHHENGAFRFEPRRDGARLRWRPYDGVPEIVATTNGSYSHEPQWYRSFLYEHERDRGLDAQEDLAAPGVLRWDLADGEAVLVLAAATPDTEALLCDDPAALCDWVRSAELERRAGFASRLQRSADAYLVRRPAPQAGPAARGAAAPAGGRTLVAGYPWFTDWGRDTFIALRGLCLATGRLDEARDILVEWAGAVSEGMLPNRFPDRGDVPEFNAVDASLWYVVAVHDLQRALAARRRKLTEAERRTLHGAVRAILTGYADGARFGIRADDDGLLRAGAPGWQLTWMDAKVGDRVITPRIGKPVEIQALWLNALWFGGTLGERWRRLFARGCAAFQARFWNEPGGWLYDVVDVEHRPGTVDASFRPNQIFAVGGLPIALLDGRRARRVVEAVEARLWTPMGLRSLAPGEPGYAPRYEGDGAQRDAVYHQGTVWPWLIGPFVEAWVRTRGGTPEARREARQRFLEPLLAHLDTEGLGHLSEIADAEPPHTPRGCPFQAWSLGEVLRLEHGVLAAAHQSARAAAPRRRQPQTSAA